MSATCLVSLGSLPVLPDDHELALCLGADEQTRLQQMRAPQRRRQFLAGHWLARRMASERAGGDIGDWHWRVDARGQPSLECEGRRLCVSVSHSDEWIACAVAEQAIGVDVEASQRLRDWDRLAAYTFAPGNLRDWDDLAPPARRDRFMLLWSLHEARAKRYGDGLSLTDTRRLWIRECPAAQAEVTSWQLRNGCLAVAAQQGVIAGITLTADTAVDTHSSRFWCFEE